MPPARHHAAAAYVSRVAGRSSFNITRRYAKAPERGQRVTRIMSAPGGVGALRGCIGPGVRLAPAFSILARRSAKLRWRSALLLAAVRILSHGSPPSLAAPVRRSGHVRG
ncbi:hypothetical protein CCO43_00080 [Salmonella enterica subsp. enterica serovar Ekotedo]|nr:hypothetical protein [Salmonella enterica subsp. enterica serovar Hillingdon]OZT95068.1 hypothetical protein CCO43_00080 [Salmonella enterica subsp. enterica serovar Ekotedo]